MPNPAPTTDQQPEYLTFGKAARRIPGHPAPSTLWRWCRQGVLARNGERIRLRHVRAGKSLYTTEQWVSDFLEAQTRADQEVFESEAEAPQAAPSPRRRRSGSKRQSAVQEADEKLASRGY